MRKIHLIVSSIILLITFISCTSNGSSAGSNSNATENQEAVAPSADKKCYASEREKALDGDTLRTKILSAESEEYKFKQRNVFQICVNMYFNILAWYDAEANEIDSTAIKENVKRFLLNAENEPALPEYEEVELPLLGTRNIITRNYRTIFYFDTISSNSMDSLAKVHPYYVEQIFAAYNEVRDEFAQKEFGKSFDECSDEQKNVCRLAYPCLVVDDYHIPKPTPVDTKKICKQIKPILTEVEGVEIADRFEVVDDEKLKNLETIDGIAEFKKLTAAEKEREGNKIETFKKSR